MKAIKKIYNKKVDSSLRNAYATSLKDPKFKAVVNNLKLKESTAIKYTSALEEVVKEISNCKDCKNLLDCKNKIEGYVLYPKVEDKQVIFAYKACKYMQSHLKNIELSGSNNEIEAAKMKDIDTTDKKRVKVIEWLVKFHKNYGTKKNIKGLYLYGNFGSGKTFLIAALLNELSKKRINSAIVYFPDLIREIKGDFDAYADKMEYYQGVDLLLIDDIGAEKVTEWSRDEVLGTILQYRMNNHLPTFFTSNLSIEELEKHLSVDNSSDDAVKARRIIERVKQMSEVIELVSENRRK